MQEERENRRILTALLGHVRSAYSFSNFSVVTDHIFGVDLKRKMCYLNLHYLFSHFDNRSCHFFLNKRDLLDKKS